MRDTPWPSLRQSGNTLPKLMSCTTMGILERRLAKDQKYVSKLLLSMLEVQVPAKVEGPELSLSINATFSPDTCDLLKILH